MNACRVTRGWLLVAAVMVSVSPPCHAEPPMVERFLISGELTKGEAALKEHLSSHPDDEQARFGLGVLQFFQSFEQLGRFSYEFGSRDNAVSFPFVGKPSSANPNPKQVTYQDFRAVLEAIITHLDESDKTLAQIKSTHIKMPLHLFQFHIDFDNDGKVSSETDFKAADTSYADKDLAERGIKLEDVVVVFDAADVQWLRGYTNMIRTMCETTLAYDQKLFWDVAAPMLFKKPDFAYKFIKEEYESPSDSSYEIRHLFDGIAAIHNLNFKLTEPDRLKKAHRHLKQVVVHSREMWKLLNAETDNDREWIPNPRQESAVSLEQVSEEMVATWDELLDEVDEILDGKKLLPFWRGTEATRGVNLRKFFHEPHDFDVILWIQGSGAIPFLENGDVTDRDTWARFQRGFGGRLSGFAIWFN